MSSCAKLANCCNLGSNLPVSPAGSVGGGDLHPMALPLAAVGGGEVGGRRPKSADKNVLVGSASLGIAGAGSLTGTCTVCLRGPGAAGRSSAVSWLEGGSVGGSLKPASDPSEECSSACGAKRAQLANLEAPARVDMGKYRHKKSTASMVLLPVTCSAIATSASSKPRSMSSFWRPTCGDTTWCLMNSTLSAAGRPLGKART
mmetsp:Transcript_5745/g.21859  ORF Transcript_5745/g.21859 Transcript_5745/m.21859 type:complete len:202 (+) Transcript_5745:1533-2138(+)